MDIKTRLEDESIFYAEDKKMFSRIKLLNKKGVFTIEDFINADVDSIVSNPHIKKQYKALQKILSTKYLNSPLVLDVLLNEKVVPKYTFSNATFAIFGINEYVSRYVEQLETKNLLDDAKIIDIMILCASERKGSQTGEIASFYVDYYVKKMISIDETSASMESAKQQLLSLINERDLLDAKILELTNKFAMQEGNTKKNGKR